ncbi:MAG: hypothetical protein J1F69_01720 [Clostridiales bacterium]|nr:hypothetical protein [Clostridiales bacterium]
MTIVATKAGDCNFYSTSTLITFTGNKALANYILPSGLTAIYGETLADVKLPNGWTWDDALSTKAGNAGKRIMAIIFAKKFKESKGQQSQK